jgi:hypothetical protein
MLLPTFTFKRGYEGEEADLGLKRDPGLKEKGI